MCSSQTQSSSAEPPCVPRYINYSQAVNINPLCCCKHFHVNAVSVLRLFRNCNREVQTILTGYDEKEVYNNSLVVLEKIYIHVLQKSQAWPDLTSVLFEPESLYKQRKQGKAEKLMITVLKMKGITHSGKIISEHVWVTWPDFWSHSKVFYSSYTTLKKIDIVYF